jgi:hypothetical protein
LNDPARPETNEKAPLAGEALSTWFLKNTFLTTRNVF